MATWKSSGRVWKFTRLCLVGILIKRADIGWGFGFAGVKLPWKRSHHQMRLDVRTAVRTVAYRVMRQRPVRFRLDPLWCRRPHLPLGMLRLHVPTLGPERIGRPSPDTVYRYGSKVPQELAVTYELLPVHHAVPPAMLLEHLPHRLLLLFSILVLVAHCVHCVLFFLFWPISSGGQWPAVHDAGRTSPRFDFLVPVPAVETEIYVGDDGWLNRPLNPTRRIWIRTVVTQTEPRWRRIDTVVVSDFNVREVSPRVPPYGYDVIRSVEDCHVVRPWTVVVGHVRGPLCLIIRQDDGDDRGHIRVGAPKPVEVGVDTVPDYPRWRIEVVRSGRR